MKRTLLLICAFVFGNSSFAEEIEYKLSGTVSGAQYSINVAYDNSAQNITNIPVDGWQNILTIPDATISLTYNDSTYKTSGAKISFSNEQWGQTMKVESINSNSQLINTIMFQIDADHENKIMNPLDNRYSSNASFNGGTIYLYVNDIGAFTSPWEFIDPQNNTISKNQGASSETCTSVVEVASKLKQICPDQYTCPPEINEKIEQAIIELESICQ